MSPIDEVKKICSCPVLQPIHPLSFEHAKQTFHRHNLGTTANGALLNVSDVAHPLALGTLAVKSRIRRWRVRTVALSKDEYG